MPPLGKLNVSFLKIPKSSIFILHQNVLDKKREQHIKLIYLLCISQFPLGLKDYSISDEKSQLCKDQMINILDKLTATPSIIKCCLSFFLFYKKKQCKLVKCHISEDMLEKKQLWVGFNINVHPSFFFFRFQRYVEDVWKEPTWWKR